ncbi:MAG TPA: ectoine hydrolase [Sandaracinaceae bacterium LLY-WYZ-13_1]|nr:ectoine hydrolase [Sandaracinaceae bacterium LLY-WYZ-13_1]
MRQRDDMTFPMEEYERRLGELRRRMRHQNLDVVIITDPENLFYLTEYQTTGYSYFQALIVPLEGEPFMVTRLLEETNVHARTWVELTRPYTDTGDAIETLWHALQEFGLHQNRTIGYERNSYYFPAYQQDRMISSWYDADFVDCFGIVEEGRIIKSGVELEVMRKAAFAGQKGMAAGLAAIRAGVTENEIAAEICAAMFRAGGEYPAVLPYVTSGPRCMIGHATWEGRTVEEGDTVFLEVGGCFRRYHAAQMRTAYVGEPPHEVREAEVLVQQALDHMLSRLRPGITVSDADRVAREILGHGHSHVGGTLVTRAGYSIGIAFAPSWDEGYIMSLKPGDHRPLEQGMTFHIIPWLFGYEGDRVMGISETIVITEHGCEPLADLDRGLVVKS